MNTAKPALVVCLILLSAAALGFYIRHERHRNPFAPANNAADLVLPAMDEQPATQPTAPQISGKWRLTLHDEFDGPALAGIWTPHQYWDEGPTAGEGDEESDPANVSVAHGLLQLTARKDNRFHKPYTGALVQAGGIRGKSKHTFSFLHGFIEARIRIPQGQGLWPAFWLMPTSYHDANGEIDIMDNGTGNPNVLHCGAIAHGRDYQHQHPAELAPGFHIFAVDWQADHITWYVDAKPWAQTQDATLICAESMYPIFDLAVGGKWGGPPNASTQFPAVMDVDWIRVWQRRD